MGGSSSTASQNASVSQVTETNASSQDNRQTDSGNIGGNVSLTNSDGNTITNTDYGAIQSGAQVSMAALDFGADAVESGNNLALDLFMGAGNIAENAMSTTASAFKDSLDSANQNAKFYAQQTGAQLDRALAFADSSTRSDSSETMGLLVKVGGAVGAAAVVAMALKGK